MSENLDSIRERLRKADEERKKKVKRLREREWNRNKRIKLRELISEMKSSGCALCGESHIACLDWHHIDQRTKDIPMSKAMSMGLRKAVAFLKEESKKCQILCANCHRKLHYENGTRGRKVGRSIE